MNIEIFPCSGGMAEGFRRAGIRFHLAIDKDPHAVASYERNHHHRPLQMDVNDFARMVRAGWRPPEPIDLFLADPPCTPHSRAGKRLGLEDERDCMLVTADLIRMLRPRAYLIGNVPGLQDSTSWHIVQDVIGGLAAHGYCVVDYASLDAADYGVPKFRVRPFWFGHLDGPCLRWPAPTHGPATTQLAIGEHALLPWVTCRQALGHLPIGELGRPVRMKIRAKGQAVLQWPWDRPSTTILGDERLSVPGHHDAGVGNSSHKGPNAVVLSARAAAVLQGFPDGECTGTEGRCAQAGCRPGEVCPACGDIRRWHFTGVTKKAVWSQLGQAMPPTLAEAVARSVAEQMRAARAEDAA